MPQAVSEVFEPLKRCLMEIHEEWALYQRVFGYSEERVYLLNRISSVFFGHTQWALYFDVVLALSRLVDRPNNRDQLNLTLEHLIAVIRVHDPSFADLLAPESTSIRVHWESHFKDLRHKRISHNDRERTIARFSGKTLNWPGRADVQCLLDMCTKWMQEVHLHYSDKQFGFDFLASEGEQGAEQLLRVLQEFADYHEAGLASGTRLQRIIGPPRLG
jgi:hypothetical protein